MLDKQEFARRYMQNSGGAVPSVTVAAAQIDRMFETLAQVLHETGSHRVNGFGTWEIRQRVARKGHNPRTGEPIKIKASKGVVFRPASALRERVQKAWKGKRQAA